MHLSQLLIDGYDLLEVEDTDGANILQVAERSGNPKAIQFLTDASNFEVCRALDSLTTRFFHIFVVFNIYEVYCLHHLNCYRLCFLILIVIFAYELLFCIRITVSYPAFHLYPYLHPGQDKREWLHKAVKVGSLPHVQYIADSEELARAKDDHGRTSLHLATLCEEKDIMEFLATQYPSLLGTGDNVRNE